MKIYSEVKKNTYQDSMKLMRLQARLNEITGISSGVAMGTKVNKKFFKDANLFTQEIEDASASDLCIAIMGDNEHCLSEAINEVKAYFESKRNPEEYESGTEFSPKSLSAAMKLLPAANIAMISVPGPFAAFEAIKALKAGLHVFLFSDNVSIEDEVELKEMASRKGLLVMGPDCGTSIISGIPLGFSNKVKSGKIGIVGASGTGMQEICCLVDWMGEGISQAIGTGGRDLYKDVGGKTFIAALESLLHDEETEVVILMSKHCDETVAMEMVERAKDSHKPLVIYFPGLEDDRIKSSPNTYHAQSLEHVARSAVALVNGKTPPSPLTRDDVEKEMQTVINNEVGKFSSDQKYMRALFSGGSFADQANIIIPQVLNEVYSYPSSEASLSLPDPFQSHKNTIIDLGEDIFTEGKPHPMIDPTPRALRIVKEATDVSVRVLLLDVVLGFGAHPDPATILAEAIVNAKKQFAEQGGHLSVVVSLCGSAEDPQGYKQQKIALEESGALVTANSTMAAYLASVLCVH